MGIGRLLLALCLATAFELAHTLGSSSSQRELQQLTGELPDDVEPDYPGESPWEDPADLPAVVGDEPEAAEPAEYPSDAPYIDDLPPAEQPEAPGEAPLIAAPMEPATPPPAAAAEFPAASPAVTPAAAPVPASSPAGGQPTAEDSLTVTPVSEELFAPPEGSTGPPPVEPSTPVDFDEDSGTVNFPGPSFPLPPEAPGEPEAGRSRTFVELPPTATPEVPSTASRIQEGLAVAVPLVYLVGAFF